MFNPKVNIAFDPEADFNFVEGFVSLTDSFNMPPGPISGNRTGAGGVPVPRQMFHRRIWIVFELPFALQACGNVIGRLAGVDVFSVPYDRESGAAVPNPFRAAISDMQLGTGVYAPNGLNIDLPAGGFGSNCRAWNVKAEVDTVTWEPDPDRGITNAASGINWRWCLAVLSQSVI